MHSRSYHIISFFSFFKSFFNVITFIHYYMFSYAFIFSSIDFYLQLVWIVVYNFEREKMMLAMSNFLFQDGVNVAYLNMENHKKINTRRIWHYLSNLEFFFLLRMDLSFQDFSWNHYKCFDNLVVTRFNLYIKHSIMFLNLLCNIDCNLFSFYLLCNLDFFNVATSFLLVMGLVATMP
jgi:hypothetical protein